MLLSLHFFTVNDSHDFCVVGSGMKHTQSVYKQADGVHYRHFTFCMALFLHLFEAGQTSEPHGLGGGFNHWVHNDMRLGA